MNLKELNDISEIACYYFAEASNQIVCVVKMMDGEIKKYYGNTRTVAYERARLFLN